MGWMESDAQQVIEFKVEPAIIAEVIQDILGEIGKVKNVSRETGVIEGTIKKGLMAFASANIRIRIAKRETDTQLNIHITRKEAVMATYSGAEKAMSTFLSHLGNDVRLAGKAQGGW